MLGFIQGLLLIIIEVSIYFFYAQTFCEAGQNHSKAYNSNRCYIGGFVGCDINNIC